jgi:hypothetical protein
MTMFWLPLSACGNPFKVTDPYLQEGISEKDYQNAIKTNIQKWKEK